MSLNERLLSNNASLLKRTVLILGSVSLILYLVLGLLAMAGSRNLLPFGWRVDVAFPLRTYTGKVPAISQDAVRKALSAGMPNPRAARFISFKTLIHSRSKTEYLFILADPGLARLRSNGKPARVTIDQHRQKILLDQGWNEIEIRYAPRKRGWPKTFSFYLKFFAQWGQVYV